VRLFTERIRAWEHGPVVQQVWHECKEFGPNPIPKPPVSVRDHNHKVRSLMDEVYSVYGQFSALAPASTD